MFYEIHIFKNIFRIKTNSKGKIIDVCKLGKWMKGKHILYICNWLYKNNGNIYPSKEIKC